MSHEIIFDYAQINQLVDDYELDISPSQLHGIITGSACMAGLFPEAADYLKLIKPYESMNPKQLLQLRDSLNACFNHTLQLLDSHMFEFELALPDENSCSDNRTDELAAWCRGFITACGSSVETGDVLGADAGEAFQDVGEIACAVKGEGETEEIEQALAELQEYVRISVQLIFDDLNPGQTVH